MQLPPILPTKLFKPPPPSNLVSRPRLLDRLEAGSAAKLTLVSAPAGYGKSTLLVAWVQTLQVPAAWLTLDSGDNDLLLATRLGKSIREPISTGINSTRVTIAEDNILSAAMFAIPKSQNHSGALSMLRLKIQR